MAKNLENKSGWLIGGGILAAVTASACCIGPLILTVLGISGAAAISRLGFLRIPMILVVVALFGIVGYTLLLKRRACEPGSLCADPKRYRKMIIAYWIGLLAAILTITSPTWISWFF